MSIIADTLQRLQTQTKSEVTHTTHQPSLVLPARGKREPGWHRRPSPLNFWLVGIGIAIGLSSLGLGAYWIGLHLDFGMPTEASPSPGQRLTLSDFSPLLTPPPVDSPFSEAMQRPAADSVENRSLSVVQKPEEESSLPQEGASPIQSAPLNFEQALPTPPVVKTPVSSAPATRSIVPTPDHPQQKTLATSVSSPNTATDRSPKHQSADPNDVATSLPATPFAPTEQPYSHGFDSTAVIETGTPIPLTAPVDEEQISPEAISNTTAEVINKPPLLSIIPTLKHEEPQPSPQVTGPAQQSPANWLHHAQQLIHAGKYEEAGFFLSPLIKDSPVNWEPWFWMGTALLGQGHLDQADQFFLSGLARDDKIPQLWIQRALVAHQRGDYQLAIHELRRAESLDAALPHIHLNMGYAYEKLGNDRLANDYYAKFLKLSDSNPTFFSIRKKLYAHFTEQVHSTQNPGISSTVPGTP